MSVGTELKADEESFASASKVFPFAVSQVIFDDRFRLEVRDSSVARVSINIVGNIFSPAIQLVRIAPSE